jgi:hypothetical protein
VTRHLRCNSHHGHNALVMVYRQSVPICRVEDGGVRASAPSVLVVPVGCHISWGTEPGGWHHPHNNNEQLNRERYYPSSDAITWTNSLQIYDIYI